MDPQELGELGEVFERGRQTFVEVGRVLAAIRDRRGYRLAGFTSFEKYLRERLGLGLMHAAESLAKIVPIQHALAHQRGHPGVPQPTRSAFDQPGDAAATGL